MTRQQLLDAFIEMVHRTDADMAACLGLDFTTGELVYINDQIVHRWLKHEITKPKDDA